MKANLNNKVLEAVHASVGQVERTLKSPRWQATLAKQHRPPLSNFALSGLPDRELSLEAVDTDGAESDASSVVSSGVSSLTLGSSSAGGGSSSGGDVANMADFDDGVTDYESSATAMETTKDTAWQIGQCLLHAFPEQCGTLLVRNLPDSGIRLLQSNTRATVEKTSSVMQKVRTVGVHGLRFLVYAFALCFVACASGSFVC
jgi:hypothetical protein